MWAALRDIVLFWVDKGGRIFRVDNPHTKLFAFWEWLIDFRLQAGDTLALASALDRRGIPFLFYNANLGCRFRAPTTKPFELCKGGSERRSTAGRTLQVRPTIPMFASRDARSLWS